MSVKFLLDVFNDHRQDDAIIWHGRSFSYGWLIEAIESWQKYLAENSVKSGDVVSLETDYSPNCIALLLAMIANGCIIVPLSALSESGYSGLRTTALVEKTVRIDTRDRVLIRETGHTASHKLFSKLRQIHHPGLVLFSSGSAGNCKAVVHDFVSLLNKFKTKRHRFRTLTFLLFDHIGGINTLLYTLSNGGCIITVQNRNTEVVCDAIEKYKVQLLPTTPTFLNLLLLSETYKEYDLSSLKVITYGTEVMPVHTLGRFNNLFPDVRFLQTYGLSEIGILRSKSKESDSLWVKLGGDGFKVRVVDGLLEIKSRSAMLGYLNAPSAFTEDGWLKTGDSAEVDGEYVKILGRESDMINVGGQKVYPAEVEGLLQLMIGVEEVVVCGESNPIIGQMVKAAVKVNTGETTAEFRKRMQRYCRNKVSKFKIPQKIVIVNNSLHSERFKKVRG